MKKKKKLYEVKLTNLEKEVIRKASIAHKEVLSYFKDNNIILSKEDALKDKIHCQYLSPRYNIIETARQISINKKYQILRDSVQNNIHHLKTSDNGSKVTQWRKRKQEENKRNKKTFIYPEVISKSAESLKTEYRTLFKKHLFSGMDPKKAEELTLSQLNISNKEC